jgi:hypothetical protein
LKKIKEQGGDTLEETKGEESNNQFEEEKMGNGNNNQEKIWDEAEEQVIEEDEGDVSFEEDQTVGGISNMTEE